MGETIYVAGFIILVLSILMNIFAVWYGRNVLRRMFYVSEHMNILVEEVLLYNGHLSTVHEMEVFYGDETLGELMRHTTGLIETLEDFAEIYTMFDEDSEQLFEEVNNDGGTNPTTTTPTP